VRSPGEPIRPEGLDHPRNSLSRTRWLLIVGQLITGVVLAGAVVHSFLNVRAAARMVAFAHGDSLAREVRHSYPPEERLTTELLNEMLVRLGGSGLRCVAVLDRRKRLSAWAGECETPPADIERVVRASRPDQITDLGKMLRMVIVPPPPAHRPGDSMGNPGPSESDESRPPPPLPRRRPRDSVDDPGRPESDESPPPPPGSHDERHFLFEFEPVLASQMNASATRSLVVGLAAAMVLVGAAFVFWRVSYRAERLQEALERDRRLAALGEMSAVLAHEIRNPLASLKGHAQLLAEKLESQEGERRKADRIVHEAVRLEALCEDLLSLVRSNAVERVDVQPAALLRDAVASVGEGRFELGLSEAPARWLLDPVRMHEVLTNLLRNAAQASPEDKPARASVAVEAQQLVFTIRDFGSGVRPGDEDRIFEPFHTTRVRGTGLGLAVARRIVELHGGSVTVRNHPAGGAEFRVSIPAA